MGVDYTLLSPKEEEKEWVVVCLLRRFSLTAQGTLVNIANKIRTNEEMAKDSECGRKQSEF